MVVANFLTFQPFIFLKNISNRDQFWSVVDTIDFGSTSVVRKDVECPELKLTEDDVERFKNSKFLPDGVITSGNLNYLKYF